ncbi:hypothetical protein IGS68_28815 (plasmid) [Skermanella sp. TT6]|uniref:Uncharacterized protein n=1 Tax=Skermanella cutis TaxID=2775420 RepID=A0ABX7BG21_9PROT|nr:hypothetical protein [Skermanella sp. TT6]QQP93147.1 hypothetical protein IGS68_28815 [Skermanella sp. TT6]
MIAHDKNRSDVGWFVLGLLFSFFALVAICALSRKEKLEGSNDTSVKPMSQQRTAYLANPRLAALISEGEKNAAKWEVALEKQSDT